MLSHGMIYIHYKEVKQCRVLRRRVTTSTAQRLSTIETKVSKDRGSSLASEGVFDTKTMSALVMILELSICLPACLFVSVYPSVSLCICLSVCLYLYLSFLVSPFLLLILIRALLK